MTKDAVLELLSQGGYVSGQKISEQLGLSRAAVWKAIDRLRSEGYTIESATNRGYCLTGRPNRLTQAGVVQLLEGHPWQGLVQVLETVDSTNNFAKAVAAQGAPHGTVILSDHQSGGRGRRGRSFSSPKGMGIYCSVVLRYDVPPEKLLHLTTVIAEATRRALAAETGLDVGIKWTNDLVLEKRKLCGILTELSLEAETGLTGYVIPGTGVNCGQQPADFPPEIRDMAISLERARAQGEEYGHGTEREVAYLAVHSVLHLLGYDHLDEGPQKAQMRAREEAILDGLGITRGEEADRA